MCAWSCCSRIRCSLLQPLLDGWWRTRARAAVHAGCPRRVLLPPAGPLALTMLFAGAGYPSSSALPQQQRRRAAGGGEAHSLPLAGEHGPGVLAPLGTPHSPQTFPRGCSWPPGIICRPEQTTHIKLLVGPGLALGSVPLLLPQYTWHQVPYPMMVACKYSCR